MAAITKRKVQAGAAATIVGIGVYNQAIMPAPLGEVVGESVTKTAQALGNIVGWFDGHSDTQVDINDGNGNQNQNKPKHHQQNKQRQSQTALAVGELSSFHFENWQVAAQAGELAVSAVVEAPAV